MGQFDALVVSGPAGAQTRTIEGATHPYVVLLNAMGDGAALLDARGAILFGNRRFEDLAGVAGDALTGTSFQGLVAPAERARFEAFLREGIARKVAQEFSLVGDERSMTPVSIALSRLELSPQPKAPSKAARDSGVLMAIITDLTERQGAEAMRFTLLERLISAEDDERRRLAQELHDETGQALTALLVGLRAIAETTGKEEVRALAMRLRDMGTQAADDVRRLARGLHPAVLDDMGLAAAAKRYAGDYTQTMGTPVDFVAGELDTPPLPPLAAATVYRILQEALTNVARHARATRVAVELTRGECGLALVVQDDGVGFVEVNRQGGPPGLGLRGMRERVTLLGGSIQIQSRPGHGTIVRAHIPVKTDCAPPPAKTAAALNTSVRHRQRGVH